jgi:hypothetical protein
MLLSAFVVASLLAPLAPPRPRKVPGPGDGAGGVAGAICVCPGDIDANGIVDAADLSLLLGSWGDVGPANLNGLGVVDAADLSILLGGWGPCTNGPPNDHCAQSFELNPGIASFCTVGADLSGPTIPNSAGCNGGAYNQIDHDVWYHFTPPTNGTITISTCGATWDTKMALYGTNISGVPACPSSGINFASLLACSDDATGCGLASKIVADVEAGEPYKLRVGGYQGHSGEGVLLVDFQPDGYDCEHAIPLGQVISASALGSNEWTPIGPDYPNCADDEGRGTWYSFKINCTQPADVIISTCHPETNFDTVLAVWKHDVIFGGCSSIEVGCNDDSLASGCSPGKSRFAFEAIPNLVYYIQVSGFEGATGAFKLTVDMGACP